MDLGLSMVETHLAAQKTSEAIVGCYWFSDDLSENLVVPESVKSLGRQIARHASDGKALVLVCERDKTLHDIPLGADVSMLRTFIVTAAASAAHPSDTAAAFPRLPAGLEGSVTCPALATVAKEVKEALDAKHSSHSLIADLDDFLDNPDKKWLL
jgi:hypothetical protein